MQTIVIQCMRHVPIPPPNKFISLIYPFSMFNVAMVFYRQSHQTVVEHAKSTVAWSFQMVPITILLENLTSKKNDEINNNETNAVFSQINMNGIAFQQQSLHAFFITQMQCKRILLKI